MKEILITSSVLIAAITAIRFLFRKTISRRVQYALWGLVLLRLLLPFHLPALAYNVLSTAEATPAMETARELGDTAVLWRDYEIPQSALAEPDPTLPREERQAQWRENVAEWEAEQREWSEATGTPVTVGDILRYVWYGGMALMTIWLLATNLRFYHGLRKVRTPYNIEDCKYPVYLCEGLPSPCLFGLFRPAIYVTSAAVEEPQRLRFVLAHEQTHARHLDPLWSLLRGACLVVYWFDPLVWLAAYLAKLDCELACDEGALARLPAEERVAYGETLLSLVPVRRGGGDPMLSATTMTAGKRELKDRITRIAENKRPVTIALFAALTLVTAVCAVTFTGAAEGKTDCDAYLAALEDAASIRYAPPFYSSAAYPAPITDADLLQAAKDYLAAVEPADGQPDLTGFQPLMQESVRLDSSDEGYYVYNGFLIAVTIDVEGEELRYTHRAIGRPGFDSFSAVESVARRQLERESEALLPDPMTLDGYLAALERAASVYYVPPAAASDRYPDPIVDADLLERVRETLERFDAPEDAQEPPFPLADYQGVRFDASDVTYRAADGYLYARRDATGETALIGRSFQTQSFGLVGYFAVEQRSRYAEPLDVVAMMRSVTADDLRGSEVLFNSGGNVPAEALAAALNDAAAREIDGAEAAAEGYLEDVYGFWSIEDAFLDGGPEGWSGDGLHFWIECGLTENVVEVALIKDHRSDTAYFDAPVLYQLVRHANDYPETVDATAWAEFRGVLEPYMRDDLARFNGPERQYTGYELTRFERAYAWENGDAADELYYFSFALLPEDPLTVGWAGGMYLDSKERVQGFNGGGVLAARRRGGAVTATSTAFFGSDAGFWPEDCPESERQAYLDRWRTDTAAALDWEEGESDREAFAARVADMLRSISASDVTGVSRLWSDSGRAEPLWSGPELYEALRNAAAAVPDGNFHRAETLAELGAALRVTLADGRSIYLAHDYGGIWVQLPDEGRYALLLQDPQIDVFLRGAIREGYPTELHDLDGDGFNEAVKWLDDDGSRGIVIDDVINGIFTTTGVNEQLGARSSDYTGLIGNIRGEYSGMVSASLPSGERNVYRYNDGALVYVCPLSEALN